MAKKRLRQNSREPEDDDGDKDFEDQDSESDSDESQRKKRGRPRKVQAKKVSTKKPVLTMKKAVSPDSDESCVPLEEHHRKRKQQYEHESQQLLNEVRDLAMQEKKIQDKLIEKLKQDITTLSQRADEERKSRKTEVNRLVAERIRESEKKKDEDNAALRERIQELESQLASCKRSTGPNDAVIVNHAASSLPNHTSNAIIERDQANKLLEVYRLMTSTDIRLIQPSEEEEQDVDDCTEVICSTTDPASDKQFEFELAIPVLASNEIEYVPSDKVPTDLDVPSYLRKELSFSRSELIKFIRIVQDVVKKKG